MNAWTACAANAAVAISERGAETPRYSVATGDRGGYEAASLFAAADIGDLTELQLQLK